MEALVASISTVAAAAGAGVTAADGSVDGAEAAGTRVPAGPAGAHCDVSVNWYSWTPSVGQVVVAVPTRFRDEAGVFVRLPAFGDMEAFVSAEELSQPGGGKPRLRVDQYVQLGQAFACIIAAYDVAGRNMDLSRVAVDVGDGTTLQLSRAAAGEALREHSKVKTIIRIVADAAKRIHEAHGERGPQVWDANDLVKRVVWPLQGSAAPRAGRAVKARAYEVLVQRGDTVAAMVPLALDEDVVKAMRDAVAAYRTALVSDAPRAPAPARPILTVETGQTVKSILVARADDVADAPPLPLVSQHSGGRRGCAKHKRFRRTESRRGGKTTRVHFAPRREESTESGDATPLGRLVEVCPIPEYDICERHARRGTYVQDALRERSLAGHLTTPERREELRSMEARRATELAERSQRKQAAAEAARLRCGPKPRPGKHGAAAGRSDLRAAGTGVKGVLTAIDAKSAVSIRTLDFSGIECEEVDIDGLSLCVASGPSDDSDLAEVDEADDGPASRACGRFVRIRGDVLESSAAVLGKGSKGLDAICRCVARCAAEGRTTPRRLVLSDTTLYGKAVNSLVDSLRECPGAWESLHLRNCSLRASQILSLLQALTAEEPGAPVPAVVSLDLSFNDVGDDVAAAAARMLETNTVLEELRLDGNCIGPVGVAALAASMQHNSTLRSLSLAANDGHMSTGGAAAVAAAVAAEGSRCALEELDLRQTGGGNAAADALASSLANPCCSLRSVSLQGNEVTAAGAIAIANALEGAGQLYRLNLLWNPIGHEGLEALADAVGEHPRLIELPWGFTGGLDGRGEKLDLQLRERLSRNVQTIAKGDVGVGDESPDALAALR